MRCLEWPRYAAVRRHHRRHVIHSGWLSGDDDSGWSTAIRVTTEPKDGGRPGVVVGGEIARLRAAGAVVDDDLRHQRRGLPCLGDLPPDENAASVTPVLLAALRCLAP